MKVRQGLFAGTAAVIALSLPEEGGRAEQRVPRAAVAGMRGRLETANSTNPSMTQFVADGIGAQRLPARRGSTANARGQRQARRAHVRDVMTAVEDSRFWRAACRAARMQRGTAITRKSDKESVRGGLVDGQGLAQSDDPIVETCPNGRQCLVCQGGCS